LKNSIKYLQQSKLIFFSFLLSFNCYGAITIVNPSADPYADIQEALILAEPGDIVRLTAGFYELEDSLSIDVENIRLEGEGIDKTVLSFKNQKSGAQGLSVTSDNVVLQDFAIEDAKSQGADAFITADLKYHQFYQGEKSLLLVDVGHYESEQYIKNLIFDYLTEKLPSFAFVLSRTKTNPVNYF